MSGTAGCDDGLTSAGVILETVAEGFYSPRDLTYVRPQKRRLTEYEAVICNTQPDLGQFEVGGWLALRPDGSGIHRPESTALSYPNWFEYRDPSGVWQRPYVKQLAQFERSVSAVMTGAQLNGAFSDISPIWLELLAHHYEAFASFEWGMFRSHAFVAREALSDTLTMASVFAAQDRLRHQQNIALYSLSLHEHIADYEEGLGLANWLDDPICQPARRLVERVMSSTDWCEVLLMTNLIIEPLYTALVGSEFFRRLAPLHGDVVTTVIEMTAEAARARNRAMAMALVKMVSADSDRVGRTVSNTRNREVMQSWVESWYPMAMAAASAFLPLFKTAAVNGDFGQRALDRALADTRDVLDQVGLTVPGK
ncbi:ferritin family protein [Mycolicibacterium gadium]|uniref:propane 2-monooxygenase n=1 Tax=Mycolicibacterium gadium TaxID=1794 RepID=A0ABT6GKP6_MYCGU|nr:monooxygenase [Mycolicibacterium gadium]MDG5481968.1 monooxygenase [Mycolicibacterium gadium]